MYSGKSRQEHLKSYLPSQVNYERVICSEWEHRAEALTSCRCGRDPTHNIHMGECAERCAEEFGISRAEQDEHALESHRRAGEAARMGITAEVRSQGDPRACSDLCWLQARRRKAALKKGGI